MTSDAALAWTACTAVVSRVVKLRIKSLEKAGGKALYAGRHGFEVIVTDRAHSSCGVDELI